MLRTTSFLASIVLILLGFSTISRAQQWSGIVSSTRAVDWSHAGAGSIPARSACQTLGTAGQSSTFSQSVTASQIMAALQSCAGKNQAVVLNPGTYTMTSTIFGGSAAAPSNVSLRGSGANQTILKWAATSNNCNGTGPVAFCVFNGDSGALNYASNVLTITSGVSSGSTSLTLGGAPSGRSGNIGSLHVGSLIAVNQTDDSNSDNGNWWQCGTNPYCTWGGDSSSWPGRQLTQIVTVTNISGSTVTVTPGLYGPKWSMSQSPYATFSANPPVTGFGLENLRLDVTSLGEIGAIAEFMWTTNSWVKGVETVNNVTVGSSAKVHYQISSDAHITVRDSYMYGANPASSGYGVDFLWGTSDSLAENNISQHMPTGYILETGIGNVFGYNYAVDNFFGANWQQCDAYHHGGGDAYDLFEGQEGICAYLDDGHGTSFGLTFFRNYWSGHDPATLCPGGGTACGTAEKLQNTMAFGDQSFNRYNNLVANVLGSTTWAKTYQNVGASGNPSACPGYTWQVVYSLGFANGNQTPFSPACQGSSFSIDNDNLVTSSLMRWGNYDVVNGSVQTNSSELASSAPVYPGLANPSTSWNSYPSFYLGSRPSWWGSMPWPAVGPDVTGGNISNVGGHAYHNPAANCYLNVLGGKTDGSSGPLNFSASSCYTTVASNNPPAPTNLSGDLIQ